MQPEMGELEQPWKPNFFYDCSGRGRPSDFCQPRAPPAPHFVCPRQRQPPSDVPIPTISCSVESILELEPPPIPLSCEQNEQHPSNESQNKIQRSDENAAQLLHDALIDSIKTTTKHHHRSATNKQTTDETGIDGKKSHRSHPKPKNLPIVCPPVELPLKSNEKPAPIVLLPCLQFPDSYSSTTEIIIDYWRRYHTRHVSFFQKEIGFFSTADRADRSRCREDYRYLKKLIYPIEQKKVNFDLNIGAEYLEAKEPPASLDSLMWWIIRHKTELFINNKFIFEFLSWRGTLRKIMCSLFESTLDWRVGVIRWHGCHFLTVFHTETELNLEAQRTPIEKRMQYWGHKFEDYATEESPPLIPSPKKIFSTMNQATLGRHVLLYSCEIDACTIDSTYHEREKKGGTYVEIKITQAKHLLDLHTVSSRKYAKWWQQCFLAGINHMLLGFRNEYGIVELLQPVTVKDIEIRAKTWSASAFISFLDEFCSFIRGTIKNDWSHENNDVYLFYYSPKEKKIKWRMSNESKYQFMPDWFINELMTTSI